MKNVIIAGVSRAGKSTLAKSIAEKYKMTYIPIDCLVSTLENLYPQIGIAHMDENEDMSKEIAKFLGELIKHLEYEDINYVLDLYQVFPVDLKEIYTDHSHVVIYLGYHSLNPEDKLRYIKEHARDKDWTKRTSDEEMIGILSKFINESNKMQLQCIEEDIEFFDTGSDFDRTIIRAFNYLEKNIM